MAIYVLLAVLVTFAAAVAGFVWTLWHMAHYTPPVYLMDDDALVEYHKVRQYREYNETVNRR